MGVRVVVVPLVVDVEAVSVLITVDEPGPDVERNLGAMLTSVLVVNRSALPFDCGSRDTRRELIYKQVPSAIQFMA